MDARDAYPRYGRALLRKAERILQSRADAQDIVHALFTDLLTKIPPPTDLDLPYLYRAVTNRCLTLMRDTKNHARLLEGTDEALASTLRGPIRSRCDDRTIDMDLLLKLTQTLDEQTLEIAICRFYDDMSQEEIAEHIGLSRKTVGRKLEDVREAVERLSAEPTTRTKGGQPS